MSFPKLKPLCISIRNVDADMPGETGKKLYVCGKFIESKGFDGPLDFVATNGNGSVFKVLQFKAASDMYCQLKPYHTAGHQMAAVDWYDGDSIKKFFRSNLSLKDNRFMQELIIPLYSGIRLHTHMQAVIAEVSDSPRHVLIQHNRAISKMVSLSQGH